MQDTISHSDQYKNNARALQILVFIDHSLFCTIYYQCVFALFAVTKSIACKPLSIISQHRHSFCYNLFYCTITSIHFIIRLFSAQSVETKRHKVPIGIDAFYIVIDIRAYFAKSLLSSVCVALFRIFFFVICHYPCAVMNE